MDRSMSRNTLMYELARQLGYYSSRSRIVELVINGQYVGVYTLNEKIKRSPERLADTDDFPKGLIIKLDTPRDKKPGWYSKHAGFDGEGYRCHFQYNYPAFIDLDSSQVLYIQQKVNAFEEAIANINDIDSLNTIVNVQSFIDFLLLQEFSKNSDAFNLSIFLHLNKKQQMDLATWNALAAEEGLAVVAESQGLRRFTYPFRRFLVFFMGVPDFKLAPHK